MSEEETPIERAKRQSAERAEARKQRQSEAPHPPGYGPLCLEQTLYAPLQLNPERDERWLHNLRHNVVQFDAHCVYCGRETTFRASIDRTPSDVTAVSKYVQSNLGASSQFKRLVFEDGQFALHVGCSRAPNHVYSYFFEYDSLEHTLTKIGQMPSLEDIAGAGIERYRKILGDDFAELRRATGLFAHGIGIGAFVYLRRIFERLVLEAQQVADPNGDRDAEFGRMRMAEKIGALASHLPETVVKFKDAYGILSKGIHELTEGECKRHFPVVKAAIIAMLEQRYEAAERAKAAAELERAIANASAETKGA
ncbi:MAG: hypothetical protein JNL14_18665 [Devosia sp.]|uniref:hypothetical protein n=1 Tax=Devosia sp. TaxID=1871048 RepID=UPI001A51750A|nr:hypothetical protein [Devosia sp.]MBL8599762.1 hypothetical protein [Devosia sp.]